MEVFGIGAPWSSGFSADAQTASPNPLNESKIIRGNSIYKIVDGPSWSDSRLMQIN